MGAGSHIKDARRILVAIALLVASPLYVVCGFMHICMAGHMHHPPYALWHYLVDGTWILGFVVSCVFCWKANLRLRKTLFVLVTFLFLSRLVLGSGGGMLFLIELPVLLVLIALAVRNLFGGAPDLRQMSQEERHVRRKKAARGWAIVGVAVAGIALLIWIGPRCYRLVKTLTAEEIHISEIPFSQEIRLAPGKACILWLPSSKTVALWCTRTRGIAAVMEESDLTFHYGEVPFKRLESEEIQLPEGGVTYGEYLSYIRQGPVITSGSSREYVLYVDKYNLSISMETGESTGDTLPLAVSVRLATEKEMITPKQERGHYLQALQSDDPKTRLEAIHELGDMVSMGSIYAGDPVEVADAIRPFLKDEDAEVRQEALVRLRVMGDDDALLEMLTPRPIPEFSEPNGAWTIAGWCRKDSDRVPPHVMTYFDTDDPKLHEFALAFFSCYKIPYPPAQPYVAKFLKSDSPAVRAAAASAVRFTCDRRTAASLLYEALGDTSEKVLMEALKDVSYFNDSIPVERLLSLLRNENPEVREKAAYALDCCRNPAAVDPLLDATHDDSARVRAQAAVSLGRIGDIKAYERLIELLRDDDADVRQSAVNGLRWLGQRSAIEPISKLADNDPNERVRDMARRTVRELRNK